MVIIDAVVQELMEIHQGIGGNRLPERRHKLGIKVANFGRRECKLVDVPGTSRQIYRSGHKRFFHRQGEVAVAGDPPFIAESFFDCLPQHNSGVFYRMVKIHMGIAVDLNMKIKQAMSSKQSEHVIKETDSRLDVVLASSIKVQREFDFGFGGVTIDRGGSVHSAISDFGKRLNACQQRGQNVCETVDFFISADSDPQSVTS